MVLGPDIRHNQTLRLVFPAGTWFGAICPESSNFCVTSITTSPAFSPADYTEISTEQMLKKFPHLKKDPKAKMIIEQLTRSEQAVHEAKWDDRFDKKA